MRLKYNAPSPNHRRVLPNLNPNRTEEDPEEYVWEVSNNFILDIPDAEARKLIDENPGELEEAPSEEPDTRVWVEKLDTNEGDDLSMGTPPRTPRTSRQVRDAPEA